MRITQRAQRIEPFYVMEMAKAAQRIAAEVKHTDQPMALSWGMKMSRLALNAARRSS